MFAQIIGEVTNARFVYLAQQRLAVFEFVMGMFGQTLVDQLLRIRLRKTGEDGLAIGGAMQRKARAHSR